MLLISGELTNEPRPELVLLDGFGIKHFYDLSMMIRGDIEVLLARALLSSDAVRRADLKDSRLVVLTEPS